MRELIKEIQEARKKNSKISHTRLPIYQIRDYEEAFSVNPDYEIYTFDNDTWGNNENDPENNNIKKEIEEILLDNEDEKTLEKFNKKKESIMDLDDVEMFINEYMLEYNLEFYHIGVELKPVYKGFFLTLEEARNHLKHNYYHYHKKATTWEANVWRSPLLERLFELLDSEISEV